MRETEKFREGINIKLGAANVLNQLLGIVGMNGELRAKWVTGKLLLLLLHLQVVIIYSHANFLLTPSHCIHFSATGGSIIIRPTTTTQQPGTPCRE